MTLVLLFYLLFTSACSAPELLNISNKNQCIRSIVDTFVTDHTCQALSQTVKSELALKITNCLFIQMGKSPIPCKSTDNCELTGDSWNTFTTFFAHIDNLCHFYWELSKAQRTENMIDALVNSAQKTQQTLSKNNQNTQQILQLQNSLKIQMLNAMATQQQMSQIITSSSMAINSLTSQISASLNKIHQEIDQNYKVVSRILSGVNQVLKHLESLSFFFFAEISSIQGVLFFVAFVLLILIGCALSQKVRLRKNQCFILVSINFLLQFCLSSLINYIIGVLTMRCITIIFIFLLILSTKTNKNQFETAFSIHMSSERMNRIMERALRKQLLQIQMRKRHIQNGQTF